ncbi:MAG: biotin/lipoyl-binding protein [Clostridia bacterium]|nr:biotin/lipoyl-binding protein [Clostridia bacterium]
MKYKVRLNKRIFEVEVEKGEAILLNEYEAVEKVAPAPVAAPVAPTAAPAAAPAPVAAGGANTVNSPLPGVVVNVKVTAGQAVKKGDVVMVLEAMKMENEINASKDGTVTAVHVAKGAKVENGTPLFDLA